MNLVTSFISIIKSTGLVAFATIFIYWSIAAILKFASVPITSTVSYRFGDDGNGNIQFPTISICLDSFEQMIGKEWK